MPKLNAQQASELAGHIHGLAQAIGDYRYDNWNTLSKTDNQKLGNLQWSLLNAGEDMLAMSATLVLPDVQQSLADIGAVTKDIKASISKLKSIQKVLNVAAAAVSLGAAIISKDPVTIGKGIGGLVKSWKE